MPPLDPAVLALIATIFGGVGLKVVEHFLGKGKTRIDEASKLREEYRLQNESQREEIKQLEEEVDKWREEAYRLKEEFLVAKLDYLEQLQNLKRQLEDAQKAISSIGP